MLGAEGGGGAKRRTQHKSEEEIKSQKKININYSKPNTMKDCKDPISRPKKNSRTQMCICHMHTVSIL